MFNTTENECLAWFSVNDWWIFAHTKPTPHNLMSLYLGANQNNFKLNKLKYTTRFNKTINGIFVSAGQFVAFRFASFCHKSAITHKNPLWWRYMLNLNSSKEIF